MKRIVLTCLLLAACAEAPTARTAPPPSATAAPSPTTAAPRGVQVAVVRAGGGLELHRVDRATRAASLERVLAPPADGARALDVTSAGDLTCAAWDVGSEDAPRSSLVCYPRGAAQGQVVEGPEQPVHVALSADGRRIAWAQRDRGENQVVAVAALTQGRTSGAQRFLAHADQPATAFTGVGVQELAWLAGDALAISTAVESDDGPALLRVDVEDAVEQGWWEAGERVEVRTAGYLTYDSVVSVDGDRALAVERGSVVVESGVPERAVRVDLRDGRVLDVLATAAQGRRVSGVSGGADAVVYVTAAGDEHTAHLRLAGEQRGTPITGLPADAQQVVATGRPG